MYFVTNYVFGHVEMAKYKQPWTQYVASTYIIVFVDTVKVLKETTYSVHNNSIRVYRNPLEVH